MLPCRRSEGNLTSAAAARSSISPGPAWRSDQSFVAAAAAAGISFAGPSRHRRCPRENPGLEGANVFLSHARPVRESGMLKIGYKASAEQFGPNQLLDFAILAEALGFDS